VVEIVPVKFICTTAADSGIDAASNTTANSLRIIARPPIRNGFTKALRLPHAAGPASSTLNAPLASRLTMLGSTGARRHRHERRVRRAGRQCSEIMPKGPSTCIVCTPYALRHFAPYIVTPACEPGRGPKAG
jgi:hypothetical protein